MELKPRTRIVNIAAKLFYDHGINTVGVAQICEEANVSKRTLYQHFATKEDLVVATMLKLGDEWFTACINAPSDDPKERIRHVFTMVESMAVHPDFYGCVFMNTSIELRGTGAPAVATVTDTKAKLYDYFLEQASRMHAKEPATLAEQLALLYDGCSAWIVMRHTFPTSVFRTLSLLLER